jgi:hypothetical protein
MQMSEAPKDWMRLEIVVAAFREEFGVWPTHVGLHHASRDEIRRFLGEAPYAEFTRKLAPLADVEVNPDETVTVVVADGEGRRMSYDDVAWTGWRAEGARFLAPDSVATP